MPRDASEQSFWGCPEGKGREQNGYATHSSTLSLTGPSQAQLPLGQFLPPTQSLLLLPNCV